MDMNKPANEWERRLQGKAPIKNGFTSDLERKVRERIRMNTTRRRSPFRAATALICAIAVLVSCWWFKDDIRSLLQPGEHNEVPAALRDDPLAKKEYELKVQQFKTYNNSFEYQFKKPFIIRHPSVKLTMTSAEDELYNDPEKFEAWFDEAQPDFVQLPLSIYMKLAADGRLQSVDTLAKQSKFDLGAFYQPLLDFLRQAGAGGELYGLSADFNTMALYVNEDLFRAKGVPLPEGELTMEQILQLAARFQGTGVGGLETADRDNKFGMVRMIGQMGGLQTIADRDGTLQASVNSDSWKNVWRTVADGYKQGWLTQAPPVKYDKSGSTTMKDIGKQDPFATGKVAMTIQPSYYFSNLEEYQRTAVMKAEWSARAVHIDESATNQAQFLSANTVFAINAKSTATDAAWELLQFVADEAWSGGVSSVSNYRQYTLLADSSNMDAATSKHWQAFYDMAADPAKAAESYAFLTEEKNAKAAAELETLAKATMTAILDDKQSVDAAVDDLQTELQAKLAAIGTKGGEQR